MNKLTDVLKKINYFHVVIILTLISFQLDAQPPTHDPCNVMRDGNRYWVFYTNVGIGAISAGSADFSDWQSEPSVFGDTWPSWINSYVPDFWGQFWAPACIYMNNQYYLYYSCSMPGESLSAIGLATSPSLNDPDWTDQGMVISSDGSSSVNNTIDPAIFKDDDGRVWMTYGSWFGGIAIVEIDSITGKTIGGLTQLAGGNHQDIEASYLLKHDGYYYLFVNRANCCRGVNSTYYIEVGRSVSVTGPYGDWRTFLETDGRYIGPGHFGYNEGRLTYHIYDRDDEGASKLINTTLGWSDGWPVAGEVSQDPPGTFIVEGTYRIRSSDSSKIIGVSNNAPIQGSNVQIWDYTEPDISGQSWTITNTCFNNNKVSPKDFSNLGFDVYNCTIEDSANIGLWGYWGGDCQQWNFYKLSNGSYQIKSKLSNKCLEIAGSPIAEGGNIFQSRCDTSKQNQQFWLELLESDVPSNDTDSFPVVISYTSEQCGNPASNIIDGNTADNSRWATRGFPKSVVIDYGETKAIIGVKVWTYQSRAYQYTVDFDDNADFTSPFEINRNSNTSTSQPIYDTFDTIHARYIRLTVTRAAVSSIEWVGITEFAIVEEDTSTKVSTVSLTKNIDFYFYPNPVEDELNLKLSTETGNRIQIAVYNIVGQVVYSQNNVVTPMETMNLSGLCKGIYSIVISNDQFTVSKRFVKQ